MFFAAVSVSAAKADLEHRAGAGRLHLAQLDAQIGVVLLVLLDADDFDAVAGGFLFGDGLLQVGVRRRVVEHAHFADGRLVAQIGEAGFRSRTGAGGRVL